MHSGAIYDDQARPRHDRGPRAVEVFWRFAAIQDVTFAPQGEVVAFLGPNGAGKSTTMKLLTGYLAPSAGVARIAGHDMATDRLAGLGPAGLSARKRPAVSRHDAPEPAELFRRRPRTCPARRSGADRRGGRTLCALGSVIGKPIGKLSRGYRQRVGMAQVLLHEPDVLILDEPTAGLDPNQIHEVRETIRKLGQSKTILLSTHILQEVEAMASRVLFINEGRLVFDGPISEVTKRRQAAGRTVPRADGGVERQDTKPAMTKRSTLHACHRVRAFRHPTS